MKLSINYALIEVTRKCNMTCSHCLRGARQNKIISTEHLKKFFSKIDSIGTLIITGGEPSLVPDKIREIIQIAKRYKVDIQNFYLVTNGKKVSDQFLLAIIELYNYCSENETSGIRVSNDDYHEMVTEKNRLKVFALTDFDEISTLSNSYRNSNLLNQGNAEKNGLGNIEICSEPICIEDEYITEGEIYLNCNGNIIHGCEWSYKNQEKHKICSVDNLSLEAIKAYT